MTVVLARIDDRLVHGQVIVAWGQKLRPDRIVLASDEIAADAWQSRVYTSTIPPHIDGQVVALAAAAGRLTSPGDWSDQRNMLLTSSPVDMLEIVESGLALPQVNIGGMHFSDGKQEVLPFVFVDRRDLAALRGLVAAGARLVAQQVPASRSVVLTEEKLCRLEENF